MYFVTLIIWENRLQSSYLILPPLSQNFIPLSPSPSTHVLLPSSSYPWLPMVVSLFLNHILLEVVSSITYPPSLFCYHWSSRSKGLYWQRRSKAYKLYMELHLLEPELLFWMCLLYSFCCNFIGWGTYILSLCTH